MNTTIASSKLLLVLITLLIALTSFLVFIEPIVALPRFLILGMLAAGLFSLILVTSIAFLSARQEQQISRAIHHLQKTVQHLAAGDTQSITTATSFPEVEILGASLEELRQSIYLMQTLRTITDLSLYSPDADSFLQDTLSFVAQLLGSDLAVLLLNSEGALNDSGPNSSSSKVFVMRAGNSVASLGWEDLPFSRTVLNHLYLESQESGSYLVVDPTHLPSQPFLADTPFASGSVLALTLTFGEEDTALSPSYMGPWLCVMSSRQAAFSKQSISNAQLCGEQIGRCLVRFSALERLTQERGTLDSILRSLNDGLVLTNPGGRIVYFNRRAAEVTGISPEEALGFESEKVMVTFLKSAREPEKTLKEFAQAQEHAQEYAQFECYLNPGTGGTWRTVIIQLFPVYDASTTYLGLGTIFRDISAEREADHLKNQFINLITHETRTPLSSVLGFAELLLYKKPTAPKTERYLKAIYQEARRLITIINDFMDIEQINSGKIRYQMVAIFPSELIQTTLQQMEAFLGQYSGHQIIVEASPDLPAIWGDKRRLSQVLTNLVANAVKYSPEGGTVTITATLQDTRLRLAVSDEGIGIDPAAQEKLFTRFYRVQNDTEPETSRGTGLGLAIAQAIVERHGSTIEVSSTYQKGSIFWFELPLASTIPPPSIPLPSPGYT